MVRQHSHIAWEYPGCVAMAVDGYPLCATHRSEETTTAYGLRRRRTVPIVWRNPRQPLLW